MKKIFPTILFLFFLTALFTIPTIQEKNTLRTNLEIQKEEITNHQIYLLNKEDYLTEVDVYIPKEKEIENLIEYLKVENTTSNWKGYLPKDLKIIDYEIKENLLKINFSKELETIPKKYLSGLIHSLLKLEQVEEIELLVESNPLKGYEKRFNKTFPINEIYERTTRRNPEKMVIYYMSDLEEKSLVPVTKYINPTSKNKIEVILEELKTSIPEGLISLIPEKLELLDYEVENDMVILNWNQELEKDKENEKFLLKEISSSLFQNMEITSILYKVDGHLLKIDTKSKI